MNRTDDTCAVIVNYRTPDLLEVAVRSFKRYYTEVPLLIVDNGSGEESRRMIARLQKDCAGAIEVLYLPENLGHGPAMNLAIQQTDYRRYLFLDSDTETLRGGFLEKMLAEFADESVVAVGEIRTVDHRGFIAEVGAPTPNAAYMLVDRRHYLNLPPFEQHGAPTFRLFHAAVDRGLTVVDFPVGDYVHHHSRGTVSRFGYGLGFRGYVNFLLHKLGL